MTISAVSRISRSLQPLPDDTGETYVHAVVTVPAHPLAVRINTGGFLVWRDRLPSGRIVERLGLHRDDPVLALILVGPYGDAARWALDHAGDWKDIRHG